MLGIFYQRPREYVAESLPDGLLVARSDGGEWFILRGTSVAIWEALERPGSVGTISAQLASTYAGDIADIKADVAGLLAELEAARLITAVDPPQS